MSWTSKEQIIDAAKEELVKQIEKQLELEHVTMQNLSVTAQFEYAFASVTDAIKIAPDTGFDVDIYSDATLNQEIELNSHEYSVAYNTVAEFVEQMREAASDNDVQVVLDLRNHTVQLKGILFDINQFLAAVDEICSGCITDVDTADIIYNVSDISIDVYLG